MPSDYERIRQNNLKRYGTEVGTYGPMLLSDRYADRTHFIYELLQNTEDALSKRSTGLNANNSIKFDLSDDKLVVSHFGKPFDGEDVESICSIAHSTKGVNDIGCFGIGFKSVYAFSDRPEIHSGDEDFVIEDYVSPRQSCRIEKGADETKIILPLKNTKGDDSSLIHGSLEKLGSRALLFLRQIREIEWNYGENFSGFYLKNKPEDLGEGVQSVSLIGQKKGSPEIDERWLIFYEAVKHEKLPEGSMIQIAFQLTERDGKGWAIKPLEKSPLVVYFPTVLQTYLGFLVQGPYKTTPSRDNVPPADPWNKDLVKSTGELLIKAIRWLRDKNNLNVEVLSALPIDKTKFGEDNMFAAIYEYALTLLKKESVLPCDDGAYTKADEAKLGRTKEIRELLSSRQLGDLYESESEIKWLSGDISEHQTPVLRNYIMRELDIKEVTPATFVGLLTKTFLEKQSDEWMLNLYEYLSKQSGLRHLICSIPLLRLKNGHHVLPPNTNRPDVFLPCDFSTNEQTMKPSVCESPEAMAFLKYLGLREPDPVDDVVLNVLPKYSVDNQRISDEEYSQDLRAILRAYETDLRSQRDKLVAKLRNTPFIKTVEKGSKERLFSKPVDLYLSSENMKDLFENVNGVKLVDDSIDVFKGKRDFLEAVGVSRCLAPIEFEVVLSDKERKELRKNSGCENISEDWGAIDKNLRGMSDIVDALAELSALERIKKSKLIWEALIDAIKRKGTDILYGIYEWKYYQDRKAYFQANWVKRVNETPWISNKNGDLCKPSEIDFEELGWEPHLALQQQIIFKPRVIEALAKEAGIDPGLLLLLKERGITSQSALKALLDAQETRTKKENINTETTSVSEAVNQMLGSDEPEPTKAVSGPREYANVTPDASNQESSNNLHQQKPHAHEGETNHTGERNSSDGVHREFHSYIGVSPEPEETDTLGGEAYQARIEIENKAIQHILINEPELIRTGENNPGFDLYEVDGEDVPVRWVEVKAMAGEFRDRPATMSKTQFEHAMKRQSKYWLYVVENATSDTPNIIRINDPAGKARSFTFDDGWAEVAESHKENKEEN